MEVYNKMEEKILTQKDLETFKTWLIRKESSPATIEKYTRAVCRLMAYLSGRPLTKDLVCAFKDDLLESGLASATVNTYIAAENAFFESMDLPDSFRIKSLKIQRKIFTERKKELTKAEYERLVEAARKRGDERLALLFETICATGIRVGEVKYITAGAAKKGRTSIRLKGKIRTILLPEKLCRKLKKYAAENHIASGEIFLSKTGKPLSRKQIWADMKSVCRAAGVEPEKVFPHNLRHLFAREFYKATKDVVKLADVLGHSNISTTRIYLISTEDEHRLALEALRLVC